MGDKKKILIITISLILLIIITIFSYSNKKALSKDLKDNDWISNNIELIKDRSLGKNIYKVYKNNAISIYNLKYQKVITKKITNLIKDLEEDYLVVYNPYGTNPLSINIYFKKDFLINDLSYEITTPKTKPYTNNLNVEKDKYAYQIIGLTPGENNTIKLYIVKEDKSLNYEFKIDLSDIEINALNKLSIEEGPSKANLEDGLYAILGNESDYEDYIAIYDNNGYIRSELPLKDGKAYNLIIDNNYLYYNISDTEIIRLNSLGEITSLYKTGTYTINNDYHIYNNNLILIASDTKKPTINDCLIKINIETNELTEISFTDIFRDYLSLCKNTQDTKLDYLHFNSFVIIDNTLFISSKETSSIFKISNIYENPHLEYIIGPDIYFKDTNLSNLVYQKLGDFKIHSNQNSLEVIKDTANSYYISIFNNNYLSTTTRFDLDLSSLSIDNTNPYQGDNSMYYLYKIDEVNKTYELSKTLTLDYSGLYSNASKLANSNLLATSAVKGVFAEYDENYDLIRKYTTKLNKNSFYQVKKLSFTNYWFK